MADIVEFLRNNYQWFFSGLGVFLLSFLAALVARKIYNKHQHSIRTKGNNSPGIVGGNYKVTTYDKKKNEYYD